jgi:RNA polymerase sigma-70 factor (ECF subfamily)
MADCEDGTGAAVSVEQLFQAHYTNIVAYVRRMVRDAETARDITQDVFLSAYRIVSAEPERVLTKAWLYKVAANGAISFLRRKKIVAFLPMTDHGSEAITPCSDETLAARSDVLAAVRALPEEQRAAVVLTLCYGYSSIEAGEMLHVSSDVIRQRVCRGLRRMRGLL